MNTERMVFKDARVNDLARSLIQRGWCVEAVNAVCAASMIKNLATEQPLPTVLDIFTSFQHKLAA